MPSETDSPIQAQIVSETPGRIRIRVVRRKDKIASIVSTLKEELAIYRVRSNFDSGSITIFYGQDYLNSQDIYSILENLSVNLCNRNIDLPPLNHSYSYAALEVSKIASNLNQEVKKVTKGTVDLRFLLPLSFAILALRQLKMKGLQFELIPWYVLAWYAFDSFIKLHNES